MIITALMIAFIVFLAGCTQLDTTDKDVNEWSIHVIGTADECQVRIGQQIELSVDNDSLILENPTGAGQ